MDFQKNTKSKSLNFLKNILYGLSKKYKIKISELPKKYSVGTFQNTKSKSLNFLKNILYGLSKKYKTKISELPTKYSVWTFKKIQNPNL
jgi:uncharacterized protein YlxP (DUF503 family)